MLEAVRERTELLEIQSLQYNCRLTANTEIKSVMRSAVSD